MIVATEAHATKPWRRRFSTYRGPLFPPPPARITSCCSEASRSPRPGGCSLGVHGRTLPGARRIVKDASARNDRDERTARLGQAALGWRFLNTGGGAHGSRLVLPSGRNTMLPQTGSRHGRRVSGISSTRRTSANARMLALGYDWRTSCTDANSVAPEVTTSSRSRILVASTSSGCACIVSRCRLTFRGSVDVAAFCTACTRFNIGTIRSASCLLISAAAIAFAGHRCCSLRGA